MKHCAGTRVMKPLARHIRAGPLRLAAAAGFCALLAACGSTPIDAGVPASAQAEDPAARDAPTGPIDTGTYPNLNIPPKPAAKQITEAERKQSVAALQAALKRQSDAMSGDQAKNEAGRLRKLGNTHADETLKAIEAGN